MQMSDGVGQAMLVLRRDIRTVVVLYRSIVYDDPDGMYEFEREGQRAEADEMMSTPYSRLLPTVRLPYGDSSMRVES